MDTEVFYDLIALPDQGHPELADSIGTQPNTKYVFVLDKSKSMGSVEKKIKKSEWMDGLIKEMLDKRYLDVNISQHITIINILDNEVITISDLLKMTLLYMIYEVSKSQGNGLSVWTLGDYADEIFSSEIFTNDKESMRELIKNIEKSLSLTPELSTNFENLFYQLDKKHYNTPGQNTVIVFLSDMEHDVTKHRILKSKAKESNEKTKVYVAQMVSQDWHSVVDLPSPERKSPKGKVNILGILRNETPRIQVLRLHDKIEPSDLNYLTNTMNLSLYHEGGPPTLNSIYFTSNSTKKIKIKIRHESEPKNERHMLWERGIFDTGRTIHDSGRIMKNVAKPIELEKNSFFRLIYSGRNIEKDSIDLIMDIDSVQRKIPIKISFKEVLSRWEALFLIALQAACLFSGIALVIGSIYLLTTKSKGFFASIEQTPISIDRPDSFLQAITEEEERLLAYHQMGSRLLSMKNDTLSDRVSPEWCIGSWFTNKGSFLELRKNGDFNLKFNRKKSHGSFSIEGNKILLFFWDSTTPNSYQIKRKGHTFMISYPGPPCWICFYRKGNMSS